MIFISAQPDTYYFLWQLKLQLFNFSQLGISREDIHVLIGYDPKRGLSQEFAEFIQINHQASFFTYPDLRKSKAYLSSIRPHIIHQHFLAFQYLEDEFIFYHDSDILFRVLPDFNKLTHDDTWYASDTASYLNKQYIISTVGEDIFTKMCNIVGVTPALVETNNENAGGAQYLIKYCKAGFWEKTEKDCENLYGLLEKHNAAQGFCEKHNKVQIQSWCTDMWVVWWNAILSGYMFRIHSELDFCWADSPIERWNTTKILHYTGIISRENLAIFRKTNYIHYPPFYDSLNEINKDTCSYPLKEIIHSYNTCQLKNRIDLKDVSFLILVKIDSTDRLENVKAVIQYLTTWFDANILILEVDETSQLEKAIFPPEVQYSFVKSNNPKLHRAKYNNQLICMANTPYVAIYDTDVIFPLPQLLRAVEVLRQGSHAIVSPYDGHFANIDLLLKAMFLKLPDPELFEANRNKAGVGSKRSYGGAILLNREIYIQAGMENENIFAWGPDDIERVKRMEILGYPIKRISGNLYHLTHERGINSGYCSIEERCMMMDEYLKICSMKKSEIQTYIKNWKTYA
jgi:hypothetical protein